VADRKFANRYAAAEYLYELLENTGIPEVDRNESLWAWLTLFYFDQLCPEGADGRRSLKQRARLMPAFSDWNKYYRHLLAGPWRVYRSHRDDPKRVFALLANPVYKPGDIYEQLASRQELVTNRAVVQTATSLYIDATTNRRKSGAAGQGGGSARRLAAVLNQFTLTWDLYWMTAEALIKMLPSEFDRFRPVCAHS